MQVIRDKIIKADENAYYKNIIKEYAEKLISTGDDVSRASSTDSTMARVGSDDSTIARVGSDDSTDSSDSASRVGSTESDSTPVLPSPAADADLSEIIARFPALNNDGKMVDFLLGYNKEKGVFILPTKELTSEQADFSSRRRSTENPVNVSEPTQSSMVMRGKRKATYHKDSTPSDGQVEN
jgi:hypothetical protein